jgi:hypothetical protein
MAAPFFFIWQAKRQAWKFDFEKERKTLVVRFVSPLCIWCLKGFYSDPFTVPGRDASA